MYVTLREHYIAGSIIFTFLVYIFHYIYNVTPCQEIIFIEKAIGYRFLLLLIYRNTSPSRLRTAYIALMLHNKTSCKPDVFR